MTEAANSAPARAPQIRCPACGGLVELPAELCPECCYNFRTGQRDVEEESGGSRLRLWLVGGLVLAVLAFLAAIFVLQPGEPISTPPPLPPTAGAVPDSEIGEALATLDTLADAPNQMDGQPFDELTDDPLMLQSKPILDKTRELADGLEGQQETRDDVLLNNE